MSNKKSMNMNSIVVGLSGGVDSAVAAALLLERGLRVEGLTIKVPGAKPNGAAAVAKKLGIELTEVDVSEAFERYVAAPFKAEYAAGRTPNPCILCNPNVKFAVLIRYADEHGLDGVATGHYAGTRDGLLLRGADPARDQSYMLHRLTPAVLRRTVFPLHNMEKSEVREKAAAFGLPTPPGQPGPLLYSKRRLYRLSRHSANDGRAGRWGGTSSRSA